MISYSCFGRFDDINSIYLDLALVDFNHYNISDFSFCAIYDLKLKFSLGSTLSLKNEIF